MGAAGSVQIHRARELYEDRVAKAAAEDSELSPQQQLALAAGIRAELGAPDTETDVGSMREWKPGQLRELDVDGTPVLVARLPGPPGPPGTAKFTATAPRCPHYDLPLKGGVVGPDGCLTCPFHAAAFDGCSGDIEDGPALHRLRAYPVRVRDERVLVHVPPGEPAPLDPPPPGPPTGAEKAVVIVGAGAAAAAAAQELRARGFRGPLTLVGAEPAPPYDRTKVSKSLAEPPALLPPQWFEDNDVQLRLGQPAAALDAAARSLTLADGAALSFDELIVATGAQPRTLSTPGADLPGQHTLRSAADMRAIVRALEAGRGMRVGIIGGGFIGLEAAAALGALDSVTAVTVLEARGAPLSRLLGAHVGEVVMERGLAAGVDFRCDAAVRELVAGADGRVEAIVLEDETLPVDLVLVGIGAVPASSWLGDVQLRERDGAVVVADPATGRVCDGVWAAGDVTDQPGGHWSTAVASGRRVGGAVASFLGVPGSSGGGARRHVAFFWTAVFGAQMRVAGDPFPHDEAVVRPTGAEDGGFAVYYVRDGAVTGVATMNADPVAAQAVAAWRRGEEVCVPLAS